MGDMRTLTPKTLEDMAFQNSHLFRQNLEVLKTELLSPVWTLETNTYLALNFLKICKVVEHVVGNNFYFGSVV
jgi:hypothetical protein